jgi:hypothetical protein
VNGNVPVCLHVPPAGHSPLHTGDVSPHGWSGWMQTQVVNDVATSGPQTPPSPQAPSQTGYVAVHGTSVVVVLDVDVDVLELVLVVVGGGFFSDGTQNSRRWLTTWVSVPNWFVSVTLRVAAPLAPRVR